MVRVGALFLASLLLIQSFGISLPDLVQLDELMEHARYHKEQFGDDFASFFAKHYGEEREAHHRDHQEEQSDHDQLPFQHNAQALGLQTLDIPEFLGFSIPSITEIEEAPNFRYLPMTTSAFPSGIFQPPRQG